MEQQARRIESDVEIDPNSIHGEGGERASSIGDRPPGYRAT